jgi:hypothetical protein
LCHSKLEIIFPSQGWESSVHHWIT